MAAMFRSVWRLPLIRAMGHRHFALLWTGQTFSRVGDFLYQIALTWLVLQKTGSPGAVAGVLIFSFIPMVVFLLIGGVTVDRTSRVRVMLASDFFRGGLAALIALMGFAGSLQIWHIYATSLLFGFVDAFFQPAYATAVPDLVPEADLPSANSLTGFSLQLGRIVGPALAGVMVTVGGTSVAFAFNALTFFVSAAFLLPLVRAVGPTAGAGSEIRKGGLLADMREGLGTVLRSPWLWVTISMYALANVTLVGPYSVALPFLVRDHLHASVGTLGLLYAVFPVGYVLAEAYLGRQSRLRHRGVLVYGGTLVAGAMLAMFGLPLPVAAIGAAALINGAALELGNLAWFNTLQDPCYVPRERLGRVSSIEMLGSFVLAPVGYGLAAWGTERLGAAVVFLLGGGLTVVYAGLGLLHPRIRAVD